MAVVYLAALRTARMNLVLNELGTASAPTIPTTGTAAGSLVIGTSALSGGTGVLATIPLPTTPASVSGDVLTLLGVPLSAAASGSGTAAKAELRDNAGNVIVGGLTVGTSGTDIIISNTTITAGQTVEVTSGTITHPA
jgi:hypothetical protein